MRFSPFEIELADEQRDQLQDNLAKISASPREAASPNLPFRFALVADSHDGYDNFGLIIDEINARPEIELVLFAGDITDFGATQEFVWAWKEFSRLNVPFFATPGNHDGLSQGPAVFSKMFGPTDYQFEYAGLQFVSLNTNTIEWGLDTPNLTGLSERLGESSLKSVLFTHQGPNPSAHVSDQASAELLSILKDEPVSLYLLGHLHEGFAAAQDGDTLYVKTASALDGHWMIIETDGQTFSPTACLFAECGQPIESQVPSTPTGNEVQP
ncbi:MAG TPA: metallophosphoesterase [Polyangiaceae bacterium]|nr:metallophosphoesterase [Polyangiaceae bacterium]